MNADDTAVLLFDTPLPGALAGLSSVQVGGPAELDAAIDQHRRLVVVGADADLATVLTRLLRADRLDVEVAHASSRRATRRAATAVAQQVPLIRDDTGTVLVGAATWQGAEGPLHGEAVVDDTVLFDGEVAGVLIEPTAALPGLRARVLGSRRWVAGRAAQLGTTGAVVTRDGVPGKRAVQRSTFYRHTAGWLAVR